MNAFLWIFIAVALGLMLFASIQDSLPDELSFLKGEEVATAPGGADGTRSIYEGWQVRQVGDTVELVKGFRGRLEINGVQHDAPEIGILCSKGKLDLRIDTRIPVTAPVTVAINEVESSWTKGSGNNILPSDPYDIMKQLSYAGANAKFTLNYKNGGPKTVNLVPTGLSALVAQLPPTCRS
ncbi:hypothetical protein LC612_30150 [Nostoc sp. CHAB 5834]|nr:hypothetical protein [Nostoc sp. CHAB 5834]